MLFLATLWEIFALSNNYTAGPDGGTTNNGSSSVSRREGRFNNATGALPLPGPIDNERGNNGVTDFEHMILVLRDLFEKDRQMASQSETTRCGICYLHFPLSELIYREEGFYICPGCSRTLQQQKLQMLRKQQKL